MGRYSERSRAPIRYRATSHRRWLRWARVPACRPCWTANLEQAEAMRSRSGAMGDGPRRV